MAITRSLIEYVGIDKVVLSSKNNCLKQLDVNFTFFIPNDKEDVLKITKVAISSNILEFKVINTPVGESIEGNFLTGKKLFVTGELHLKFQYICDTENQIVNSFNLPYAYSGYITLPRGVSEKSYISPSVLVEDLFIRSLNSREVAVIISLLLNAGVC